MKLVYVFVSTALLAGVGCSKTDKKTDIVTRPPENISPKDAAAVRLVDLLDDGMIEAGGPPPIPAVERMFFEDFASKKKEGVGGKASVRDGSATLSINAPNASPVYEREIPVEGRTTLEISSDVKTTRVTAEKKGHGATMFLTEIDDKGAVINAHHHLKRVFGSVDWTRIKTRLRTHRTTKKLKITLGTDPEVGAGQVSYKALTVNRISDLSDLMATPPHIRQGHRMAVHPMIHRVELEKDNRPAIVAAGGTRLRFDHKVKDSALLQFAVAVPREAPGTVCFKVRQEEKTLFDDCTHKPEWLDVSTPIQSGAPIVFDIRSRDDANAVGLLANPSVKRIGRASATPVVLVVIDTLRADTLADYGGPGDLMPNLHAFAEHAVTFRNAFSTSSWTATSLSSLMTSRFLGHCGGSRMPIDRDVDFFEDQKQRVELSYHRMLPGLDLLSGALRNKGYETVGYFNNYFFSDAIGFDAQYDRYTDYGTVSQNHLGGRKGLPDVTHYFENRARVATPFLLTYHLIEPHMPYRWRKKVQPKNWPPKKDLTYVEWQKNPEMATFSRFDHNSLNRIDEVRQFYDADSRHADQVFGELMKMMTAYDPMVVVLADHGEAFKEHRGRVIHGNSMYNELVKVPIYIRFPGDKLAGKKIDTPVSLVDVVPTVLSALGIQPPAAFEGRDMLNRDLITAPRDLFMTGNFSDRDEAAVVRWPYKLIWVFPERIAGFARTLPAPSEIELYNLQKDPKERTNFADTEQKRVTEMHDSLKQFLMAHTEGFHIQCRAVQDAPLSVTFHLSERPGQIATMTLEDDDTVSLDADDSRQMTLTLAPGDDTDWLYLRSTAANRPIFTTEKGDWEVATAPPTSVAPGRCVVWHNSCRVEDNIALSDEEHQALIKLGYMHE